MSWIEKVESYGPFGRYHIHQDPVNEPVTDGESVVKEAEALVNKVSEAVNQAVNGGEWKYNNPIHRAEKRPWEKFLAVCSGAAVVVGAGLTLAGMDVIWQAYAYSIAIALFVAGDPVGVFNRWLADQTRVIILMDVAAVIYLIQINPPGNVKMIIAAWMILSGVVCYAKNNKWLMDEKMLYTKYVMRAMRQSKLRGIARAAESRWQADGKRQCRKLLYEEGFTNVNDDILDIYIHGVYLLAFMNGLRHVDENGPIYDDEDDIDEDYYGNDEDEFEEQAEPYEEEPEEYEEDDEDIIEELPEIEEPDPEEEQAEPAAVDPKDLPEEERDAFILEMLDKQMSQTAIEREFGISRYHVRMAIERDKEKRNRGE